MKDVSLEMYPLPAVVGESLILKCLAWGTDQISHTVFYKNNSIILEGLRSTYTISDVTESAMGSYKCGATFTHKARTEGPPYKVVSDDQDVFVQGMQIQQTLFDCWCTKFLTTKVFPLLCDSVCFPHAFVSPVDTF